MALGSKLAAHLKLGDAIEFIGDLGGGKTTFIKGLAAGLGIEKTVTSPTYNIQRSYKLSSGGSLEHYDLYRLADDEVLLQEMSEILLAGDAIICVEWADHLTSHLGAERFIIKAEFVDETSRTYEFSAVGADSSQRLTKIQEELVSL